MDIHVITKEKMEALEALAHTNIKVGEARGLLSQLKADETKYLAERDKKALESIQNILTESQEELKNAFSNYEEIKKFASDASNFSQALLESYNEFLELKKTFDEYTTSFEENIKVTQSQLEETKKQIKVDRMQLKADQEAVSRAWKQIALDKIKIKDERQTLERAMARLKENKI